MQDFVPRGGEQRLVSAACSSLCVCMCMLDSQYNWIGLYFGESETDGNTGSKYGQESDMKSDSEVWIVLGLVQGCVHV